MALTANVARERAEEWLQQMRGEVERRVEDAVGRVVASLQLVTLKDVAELNARLKTIAKRVDQLESKRAKGEKTS